MTQTAKPKTWVEMSEGEKSAVRAQAYPNVLDEQGREWKLGKIEDLQALNSELLAALKFIRRMAGGLIDGERPAAEVLAKCFAEAGAAITKAERRP